MVCLLSSIKILKGGGKVYQLDGVDVHTLSSLSFRIWHKLYPEQLLAGAMAAARDKVDEALLSLPFLQPMQEYYEDRSLDRQGSYRAGYFNDASFQDPRATEKVPLGDVVKIYISDVVSPSHAEGDGDPKIRIVGNTLRQGSFAGYEDAMRRLPSNHYSVSLDGFGRLFVDEFVPDDFLRYVRLEDDYPIDASTRFYLDYPVRRTRPDIAALWTPGQEEMRLVDMEWERTMGCLPGEAYVQTLHGRTSLRKLYERYMTYKALSPISVLDEDGEVVFQSDYKVTRRFLGESQTSETSSLQFITYEAKARGSTRLSESVPETLLALTPNHFLFVERNGVASWRRAEDIREWDRIAAPEKTGVTAWEMVVDNRPVSSQEEIEAYTQEFPDVPVSVSFELAEQDPDRGALDVYDIVFPYGNGQSHNFFIVDKHGNQILVHNGVK